MDDTAVLAGEVVGGIEGERGGGGLGRRGSGRLLWGGRAHRGWVPRLRGRYLNKTLAMLTILKIERKKKKKIMKEKDNKRVR